MFQLSGFYTVQFGNFNQEERPRTATEADKRPHNYAVLGPSMGLAESLWGLS